MCGLPSVVSPVGIALDVIYETNGFITDNTIKDWKEKILACINTKYNNTYISNQLLLQFDVNTVGDFFNTVYKSI